jgi:hypothetical protein
MIESLDLQEGDTESSLKELTDIIKGLQKKLEKE